MITAIIGTIIRVCMGVVFCYCNHYTNMHVETIV